MPRPANGTDSVETGHQPRSMLPRPLRGEKVRVVMLTQNQSGSSRSTSTTVHPAASSWSCRCAVRSTSGPISGWLSATAVRGVDGSWTMRASSPVWSQTEHQSCSSSDRRIRHSTRPWVVTSGGDVVTGRYAYCKKRLSAVNVQTSERPRSELVGQGPEVALGRGFRSPSGWPATSSAGIDVFRRTAPLMPRRAMSGFSIPGIGRAVLFAMSLSARSSSCHHMSCLLPPARGARTVHVRSRAGGRRSEPRIGEGADFRRRRSWGPRTSQGDIQKKRATPRGRP